jgi:hypothetical protein
MGTTVAGMISLWRLRGCYEGIKIEIAPKGSTKGIEVLGLRGFAFGMNARNGLFGGLERSKMDCNCPGDGVSHRDFSLVRMEPIRRLHRGDAEGAEPRLYTKIYSELGVLGASAVKFS